MTRRPAPALALGALLAMCATVGLAACGDGDGAQGEERVERAPRTDPTAGDQGEDLDGYVGQPTRTAIAMAEAADRPWRITREDDETFAVTFDFVPDRLNFEIDDGTVTKVTLG